MLLLSTPLTTIDPQTLRPSTPFTLSPLTFTPSLHTHHPSPFTLTLTHHPHPSPITPSPPQDSVDWLRVPLPRDGAPSVHELLPVLWMLEAQLRRGRRL
jgi:hypothetical protein